MTTPKLSLIAAVAENGVIGSGNDLPWRIRSEMQYFMRMTKGKPCIMGRKTFESLPGGPLKDRLNIVITRDATYTHAGVTAVPSLEAAIAAAQKTGAEEIMVTGGAEIYKLALPHADRLYITEVHLKPQGDTVFPAFDRSAWKETLRDPHKARDGESADYTITVLERT